MVEKVLVVPREELFSGEEFQGITSERLPELLKAIERKSFFMDRPQAEQDPTHKQIIPYVMIASKEQIFTVTRLKTQGEARLHDKVSIGIGGHINPEDAEGKLPAWEAGLKRELTEEIKLLGNHKIELVGAINDDSTPVGSVHFGLVYRAELLDGTVEVEEKDKMTGEFLTPKILASKFERMETWSQLVFGFYWPAYRSLPSPTHAA